MYMVRVWKAEMEVVEPRNEAKSVSDNCVLFLDFTLAIDAVTGVVTLARTLDREGLPAFSVVITATDQGPGSNTDSVGVLFNH